MANNSKDILRFLHETSEVPDSFDKSVQFDNKIASKHGIIESSTGQIPYEHLMDFMLGHFVYFRLGDLFVVNEIIKDELETEFGGVSNIVYMAKQGSLVENAVIHPYSMSTMYAISLLDVIGQSVLELGSADGMLSAISRKMGAISATAVDLDAKWKQNFESHLTANELPIQPQSFIVADIEKQSPSDYLFDTQAQIVYSTLGPAYRKADLASIHAIDSLLYAHTFVLSGYRNELGQTGASSRIALLENFGFKVVEKIKFKEHIETLSYILQRN